MSATDGNTISAPHRRVGTQPIRQAIHCPRDPLPDRLGREPHEGRVLGDGLPGPPPPDAEPEGAQIARVIVWVSSLCADGLADVQLTRDVGRVKSRWLERVRAGPDDWVIRDLVVRSCALVINRRAPCESDFGDRSNAGVVVGLGLRRTRKPIYDDRDALVGRDAASLSELPVEGLRIAHVALVSFSPDVEVCAMDALVQELRQITFRVTVPVLLKPPNHSQIIGGSSFVRRTDRTAFFFLYTEAVSLAVLETLGSPDPE